MVCVTCTDLVRVCVASLSYVISLQTSSLPLRSLQTSVLHCCWRPVQLSEPAMRMETAGGQAAQCPEVVASSLLALADGLRTTVWQQHRNRRVQGQRLLGKGWTV